MSNNMENKMPIPSCCDCMYFSHRDTCSHPEVDTWGDPKESSAVFQREQGWFGMWYYQACGKKGRYFKRKKEE